MKIETTKEYLSRVEEAYEAIKDKKEYKRTIEILEWDKDLDEDLIGDLEETEMDLASDLHNADSIYPMHPIIAALVIDIYEDCIERGNKDAMCNLGSLYYTGRAGEQDYQRAAIYYEMADKAGNRQATENLG
ncbi:MAG: hypothetical protein K5682_03815, partial [Lachnospiraceae bacterium]|nr:hypothetical protein [Lachnospiraceae bacterium]